MTIKDLLQDLERKGVTLEAKLTFASAAPLDAATLAALKAHKAALLKDLTAPDTLPRLPWQLERLVSAASSDNLDVTMFGVYDLNRYTLGWAAAYLTGGRDEALARLWAVHRAWQGLN
jgi:hypothetical protein